MSGAAGHILARLLVLACIALAGASAARADLEADLRTILEDSSITGAGIVLVEDGMPAEEVYWGLANSEANQPVTADTVFRAGSISKNVTTLIALRLAARREIDLETHLRELAPDIEIENPWADTDPVRLVHLMEHTAGLPGSSYREYAENAVDAPTARYVETIGAFRLRWRPGTLYSYANAGHTLLAYALEHATGRDFDTLAREEVFEPLGMASASFATYGVDPERLARSYTLEGTPEPVWEMLIRPSGSLTSTPRDLARLVGAYASDGAGILPSDQVARMRRSETSLAAEIGVGGGAYGLGTFAFIEAGHVFYGHWGKTEGFRANMGYLPGTGKGFVIMLNTVDEAAAARLRQRIAEHLTATLSAPDGPALAAFDPAAYSGMEGAYVLATHEQPMRAWIFKALDQRRISVGDGGLDVTGAGMLAPPARLYRPVAGGGFVVDGFPLATAGFARADGRLYWIDGDAYQKVSGAEAAFRTFILPAALLVSVLVVGHGLVWGVMGLAGRGPRGDGLAIRASLLVSGLGFLVTSILLVQVGFLGDWDDLARIGTPSLVSLTMALMSLLGCLGALAALGLTVGRAVTGPRTFLIWAAPVTLILASFAALWISVGWAPLISWGW